MLIRWHGHACFEVKNGSVTVVTDPHDGRQIGLAPPAVKADLVLQSHDHFDHNATGCVSGDFEVVREPGEHRACGVDIKGIQVYHDEDEGSRRGRNIIFQFKAGGITFCHLGDLGHTLPPEIVADIGPVDVLFVPVGSVFTIDAKAAWEIVNAMKPKVAVPMHYKTGSLSLNIQPVEPFLALAGEQKVTQVGNETEFDQKDLPAKGTKVWVFSI